MGLFASHESSIHLAWTACHLACITLSRIPGHVAQMRRIDAHPGPPLLGGSTSSPARGLLSAE